MHNCSIGYMSMFAPDIEPTLKIDPSDVEPYIWVLKAMLPAPLPHAGMLNGVGVVVLLPPLPGVPTILVTGIGGDGIPCAVDLANTNWPVLYPVPGIWYIAIPSIVPVPPSVLQLN